jgi:MoCo/4Fe-4S cofactor protein with predicted Tat translocation signal
MGNNKKYWKGLEDLNNDPDFIKSAQNEFAEPLPTDFLGNESLANTSTPRRDFLKFLGFSVTAASLAACETPVRKVIPYVIKPEDVTPGVPNWYATSYYDGHDYASILVKNRDGRPIKIEGNKNSLVTRGGTSARIQAAVLSLYDSARLSGPIAHGSPSSWSTIDKEVGPALANGNIRILTSTVISPSTMKVVEEFTAKYPNTKHVVYDAISYSGMLDANKASFGKRVIPSYNFDKAAVIVSLGADFLANWISPIEHAAQYAVTRKLGEGKKDMSRHIQIESNLTVTGSNADVRIAAKPSEIGQAAVSLLAAVGGSVSAKALSFDAKIKEVAKELNENKGKALVVCGSNDVNVQIIVNAINQAIGAYGTVIDINRPCYLKQGNDADVVALVNEMKSGAVQTLIMHQVNPSYTLPASLGFNEALKKVKTKVSFADRADETASQCDYICPDHHILESWGDAMPAAGSYSLVQPVIFPLFNTRAAEETLLKWSGNDTDYQTYVKNNWEKGVFASHGGGASFNDFWGKALFDGVVETSGKQAMPAQEKVEEPTTAAAHVEAKADTVKTEVKPEEHTETTAAAAPVANAGDLNAVAAKITAAGAGLELCLYEKTGIGNGVQANNPWLQELPDPISKVTWDNYVTMNPADMRERKYNLMERAERMATLVEVSANGQKVTLPVYPSPGQAKGTIGIAVGYGRTHAGKAANKSAEQKEGNENVYPMVSVVNGTFSYVANATVSEGKGEYLLAATQTHHTMMGRAIVHETTLSEYNKDTKAGNETEMFKYQEGQHHSEHTAKELDLWATEKFPGHDKPNHFWGMAIDLNSCIGCGACVISCNAENNIPVVGKKEIAMARELHWIRIDRYFSSDADPKEHGEEHGSYTDMENPSDYPQVVFQPVMCMHCNHAPCETVCPVAATMHSSDGLNMMAYNRCVGTRYCANNCPYKVRRFNWFRYSDNAEFDFNMNDDLGKMVLNPDVVVRSRGVMEKCTMCVQRIQEGRLNAKKESRRIVDGEIQTACAQACPTNAITFGDFNDKESLLSKTKEDERMYHLLEEINTQPSVFYLTKVRNAEEVAAPAHKPEHAGETKEHA